MGYSSPKKPLDLADFLSRKGTPRRSRYARYSRNAPEPEGDDQDAETTSDLKIGTSDGSGS